MRDAPPRPPSPANATAPSSAAADAFDTLERTLAADGPEAAIARLIAHLDAAGDYRALLNALLLKARHELGLPLVPAGSLADIPDPARARFEERYVEAIRLVGLKLLEADEIPAAWPYFRAIGEPGPVAVAIDRYETEDAEALGRVIDVAFQQGANPRRGFELILEHYGTCSAITALEQAPPGDTAVQAACIERLIRHLHADLFANVRADLARRGEEELGSATIAGLIEGRDSLFADDAYHVDVSHLSATVRYSIFVTDLDALEMAVDLAEYGRRLSPRLQFEGSPPFERTFDDHRLYLRALLGEDAEAAVAHLRGQLADETGRGLEDSLPAQALVNLLARTGRNEEAAEVAAEHLAHLPEHALSCPGVTELCRRAGRMDRLASLSRGIGRLVPFLAAKLQSDVPS